MAKRGDFRPFLLSKIRQYSIHSKFDLLSTEHAGITPIAYRVFELILEQLKK